MNQPIPGDDAYITNQVPSNWVKTLCGNIPPHFTSITDRVHTSQFSEEFN